VNLRVDLIVGQFVEDFELVGLEVFGGSGVDGGVVVLEIVIEPAELVRV